MPEGMDEAVALCGFQERLNALRAEIEAAGFKVSVFWAGEYGGLEAVMLGSTDGMNVVPVGPIK